MVTRHHFPRYLPEGKEFLYLIRRSAEEKSGIAIGPLDGKPPVPILQTAFSADYDAASGRLVFLQGTGTLMAQRLELNPPGSRGTRWRWLKESG